ncbi:MAG: type II toxin-antitoxin system VapB family antitoxin [Acidobacteriota bacterium]
MLTNIDIDDKLMNEARRVSGLKTKRAVVEAGLQALIRFHGQVDVRQLWGRLHWQDPSTPAESPAPPEPERRKGRAGRR